MANIVERTGFYSNSNPPDLPKSANRTATYMQEIKYCSECPFCHLTSVYYDPEVDEDVQDIFCGKQNPERMIHWALNWTEIANRNSKHTGDDYIPEDCPLLENEPNDELNDEPICDKSE